MNRLSKLFSRRRSRTKSSISISKLDPGGEVQAKFTEYCMNGDAFSLLELLESSPQTDVNVCSLDPASPANDTFPLLYACQQNHKEVIEVLLSHPDIDVNKKGRAEGCTPLYVASERGHAEAVKLLLALGSADHLRLGKIDVNLPSVKGASPFYIACEKGRLAVVELLLEHPDIEVNKCFKVNFTPFFVACECGHVAVVERLLQDGRANFNQPQHQGATPFFMACQKGRLQVVTTLLQSPVIDVNKPRDTGATPLYIACEFNHPEVVKELLQSDRVDPNQQRKGGYTPFFRVCEKGHMEIFRIMVQCPRVDVNLASVKGTTPLYIACEKNQIATVKELIKLPQLDINLAHDKSFTPFFVACRFGHTEIVKILMEDDRTDVNKPQHQGATPFYIACHSGRVEAVKSMLKNERVDVKLPMKGAGTPLWAAASFGQEAVVKWMLVSGRDIDLKFRWSGNHKTAADQARSKGHEKVAKLLEDFEKNSDQLLSELELELGIWDKFKARKELESLQIQLAKEREVIFRLMEENRNLRRENQRLQKQATFFKEPLPKEPEAVETAKLNVYTISELSKATDNFSSESILAQGGQADVFKAVIRDMPVAIKRYYNSNAQAWQFMSQELDIMQKYCHPHLIELLGHTELECETPCLVFPLMSNGNLRERLDNKGTEDQPISWETRMKIAMQVAQGLAHLHEPHPPETNGALIHLDLTSANILLDENTDAKITDFALARQIEGYEIMRTYSAFGTIGYLCPDFLANGFISEKTDVYAFGVILSELLTGKPPIFHLSNGKPTNLSRYILEACPLISALMPFNVIDPTIRQEVSQATFRIFGMMIRRCLDPNPELRPTMKELSNKLQDLCNGTHRVCLVCMDNPTNGKMGCGHAVLCYPCAEYLLIKGDKCPLCRALVVSVEQGCYDKSFVA